VSQFVTPSGRYYRWRKIIAYCRRNPGWHRLLPNVPARVVKTVRLRRSPELRVDGGHLEAYIQHQYQDPNGVQRGDVYLRWTPQ